MCVLRYRQTTRKSLLKCLVISMDKNITGKVTNKIQDPFHKLLAVQLELTRNAVLTIRDVEMQESKHVDENV